MLATGADPCHPDLLAAMAGRLAAAAPATRGPTSKRMKSPALPAWPPPPL